MSNFAVLNGDEVTNILVADSLAVAQSITGATCVECTDNPNAQIGGSYVNKEFRPVKPFPSWLYANGSWNAPVECPDPETMVWDEDNLSWISRESI
jgi:hypothetical protein